MTCMIVDDEPLAVRLLESFVSKTPDLELMGSFTDSVEAVSAIREQLPNLLFLDIQMPDINGMELAHMLPPQTRVIFTTAFKEYAFDSYEVNAIDFLLKPVRYNKFLAAVEKAKERITPSLPSSSPLGGGKEGAVGGSSFFIRVDGELRQLQADDIVYVAGMKDYVTFHLQSQPRPLITHMTMKAVEDMLPSSRFLRVHRSYIVALDKIRSVDRNDCIYIGNEIIHVTEAFLPAFHQFLDGKIAK